MAEEKTYTLAEACIEVGRRECVKFGHRFQVASSQQHSGPDQPERLFCDRCEESWNVTPKTAQERRIADLEKELGIGGKQ